MNRLQADELRRATKEVNASRRGSLSPSRQWLVDVMRRIHHGRIEHLTVRNGEPMRGSRYREVREIKLASNGSRRRLHNDEDFVLKQQVIDLFCCLDEIRNGEIERLEVHAGLPFKLSVGQRPKRRSRKS